MAKPRVYSDKAWFARYSRAADDMRLAAHFARFAKRYIGDRQNERGKAYRLTFVVMYARPFTRSHGWPQIDQKSLPYAEHERKLHARLVIERSTLWAHTQSEYFDAKPVINWSDDATLHIEHRRLEFTTAELTRALRMMPKAERHFEQERRVYRAELERLGEVVDFGPGPNG